jgi:hypothetical protein
LRLTLSTRTAADLYARYGFWPLAHPELMMERPRRLVAETDLV